jgi:hypothetical protein
MNGEETLSLSRESKESKAKNPGIGAISKGQDGERTSSTHCACFRKLGSMEVPELMDRSSLHLPERARARVGGTQGAYPRIFLQNLGLQVDSQKVSHRNHPGQDIGHFPSHMVFSSAVSPGELPNFFKEPKEGFIRSSFPVPFQVNLPDQFLEFFDFQGFLPPSRGI